MVRVVRKRRLYKRKGKKTITKRVAKVERRVNNVMRAQDLHSQQITLENSNVPTAGNLNLLNGIAQGDDITSRESNDVYITSVSGICTFQVYDSFNTIRTLIIWDKQPNGAIPVLSDIFQGYSSALTSTPENAQRRDTFDRFKFVYDKVFTLDTYNPSRVLRFRVPVRKKAKYTGAGGTIASIASGALYVLFVSDSSAAPHPGVTCAITCNWKG